MHQIPSFIYGRGLPGGYKVAYHVFGLHGCYGIFTFFGIVYAGYKGPVAPVAGR